MTAHRTGQNLLRSWCFFLWLCLDVGGGGPGGGGAGVAGGEVWDHVAGGCFGGDHLVHLIIDLGGQ
jgi:hypothetical protein